MRRNTVILAVSTALVVFAVSGCSSVDVRFVDDGRVYDRASLTALLADTEPGSLASEQTRDARRLRQRALIALRRQDGAAADAARLLTETFPSSTDAVPYYIERARFGKVPVWIVVEARGRQGGMLEGRRLWVLEEDGGVVLSTLR